MKLSLKEKETIKTGVMQLVPRIEKLQHCSTSEELIKAVNGVYKTLDSKWLENLTDVLNKYKS